MELLMVRYPHDGEKYEGQYVTVKLADLGEEHLYYLLFIYITAGIGKVEVHYEECHGKGKDAVRKALDTMGGHKKMTIVIFGQWHVYKTYITSGAKVSIIPFVAAATFKGPLYCVMPPVVYIGSLWYNRFWLKRLYRKIQ